MEEEGKHLLKRLLKLIETTRSIADISIELEEKQGRNKPVTC
ncbi:MAG: hypothetical protein ACE5J5_04690 [Candidatus Hydrothermarchaeales archaeon]